MVFQGCEKGERKIERKKDLAPYTKERTLIPGDWIHNSLKEIEVDVML
jgi:hypothetical protein